MPEKKTEARSWALQVIAEQAFGKLLSTREDTLRPGILETPKRAAKAWFEKTSGYEATQQDIAELFKTFEPEHAGITGMVVVRDIVVESMCEHHLERVWGYAHIGYVPRDRVLGLSKFHRVVGLLSRRLSVQERLTATIADTIMEHLDPVGVGVVVEARHACMEARGIRQRGQTTTTSELRGCFYEDPSTRAEFFNIARTHLPF